MIQLHWSCSVVFLLERSRWWYFYDDHEAISTAANAAAIKVQHAIPSG